MNRTTAPNRKECGTCKHLGASKGVISCYQLDWGMPCIHDRAGEDDMPTLVNTWYKVEVDLDITKKALGVMLKCSEAHYDGKCKAASKLGGFLYGWKNHFELPEGQNFVRVRATWHEVDELCKILEMERHFSDHGDSQPVYYAIRKVLRQMDESSRRVNGG